MVQYVEFGRWPVVYLPILPTLFTYFAQGRLGELRSRYLGLKKLKGPVFSDEGPMFFYVPGIVFIN